MKIGPMRDRMTVSNSSTTRGPSGQPLETWTDGATIWAEIKGISGRELMTSGAEKAESTIRVWTRYRRDISAASRLIVLTGPYKGLILEVIGPPIPGEKGTRLEILCKQGVVS